MKGYCRKVAASAFHKQSEAPSILITAGTHLSGGKAGCKAGCEQVFHRSPTVHEKLAGYEIDLTLFFPIRSLW